VVYLARTAGEYMLEARRRLRPEEVHEKARNQLVTAVDVETERFLSHGLTSLLPGSTVMGEELHPEAVTEGLMWVVDPIDGTTNYIHGVPFYCISIALLDEGRTVLGVVYDPVHEEAFYASEGRDGAFVNEAPIRVSATKTLEAALITTGFPFADFSLIDVYTEVLKHLMRTTQGLRRPGSAALDLVHTAAGRMDGFYEYGLSPWDVAAGAYIVQKAGGRVSDFSGGDNFLFGREIVAGNPAIHTALLDVLRRFLG